MIHRNIPIRDLCESPSKGKVFYFWILPLIIADDLCSDLRRLLLVRLFQNYVARCYQMAQRNLFSFFGVIKALCVRSCDVHTDRGILFHRENK